ncbi:MAG TPA: hypothetical protein VHC19_06880 [Pirellulales bacterium]|nr:hypothetical protein [Pirellulales bacterium]
MTTWPEQSPEQLLAASRRACAEEEYSRAYELCTQALEQADLLEDEHTRIDSALTLANVVLHCAPTGSDPFALRRQLCDLALGSSREFGYEAGIAAGLLTLATLDFDNSTALLEESLAIARSSGDVAAAIRATSQLAVQLLTEGKPDEACVLSTKSVRQARTCQDPYALYYSLYVHTTCFQGSKAEQRAVYEEAADLCRQQRWKRRLLKMLFACATLACEEGERQLEEVYLREALSLSQQCGNTAWESKCLERLAAAVQDDPEQAELLLGMSRALAEPEPDFFALREALEKDDWQAAREAIMEALRDEALGRTDPPSP